MDSSPATSPAPWPASTSARSSPPTEEDSDHDRNEAEARRIAARPSDTPRHGPDAARHRPGTDQASALAERRQDRWPLHGPRRRSDPAARRGAAPPPAR